MFYLYFDPLKRISTRDPCRIMDSPCQSRQIGKKEELDQRESTPTDTFGSRVFCVVKETRDSSRFTISFSNVQRSVYRFPTINTGSVRLELVRNGSPRPEDFRRSHWKGCTFGLIQCVDEFWKVVEK